MPLEGASLVFVYGTLMRGGANHRVLERLGARFVTAATTRDPRMLVDLGPYPALLPVSTGWTSRVEGEVWELGEAAMLELDAFEGCPDLYVRERVSLVTPDGELETFVYVLARRAPRSARVIESGRYEGEGRNGEEEV